MAAFVLPLRASRSASARAVPLARIDIYETHFCSGHPNRMRRARPAQRRAQNVVSRTDFERLERELKRGGATRHGDPVPTADQRGDRLLETRDQRPLDELSRLQNFGDRAAFVLTDPWFC